MHRSALSHAVVFCCLLLGGAASFSSAKAEYDVLICGATPSGILAGVAAAGQGAKVLILEPTAWIGGMVTGGLTRTDKGNEATIGGLTRAYFEQAAALSPGSPLWYAEPHANMEAFQRLIAEHHLEVRTGQILQRVEKEGTRLRAVVTHEGEVFEARQFIDASYEGDLMALAGVSCIVGRESRAQYGEPLAGYYPMPVRERTPEVMTFDGYLRGESGPHYVHGTPVPIRARDEAGHRLRGVLPAPDLQPGDADEATQSYNFRLVVTQNPELRVPFPKPERYDPLDYELLLRLIQAFPGIPFGRIVHLGEVGGGKYDLNAQGLFSTDFPGASFDYPAGDWATRRRIYQAHQDYVQGLLWFLGHDERVPTALRQQVASWGLCRDEFVDNDHWPYALYVREGRRLIGVYVMTQADCQQHVRKPDAVAMGSFLLDCHIVRRIETPDGFVTDEGSFPDTPTRPYQIPYRSLTPRVEQCENLLVPVCLSASHVACCSLRMEPVYMALGHASGLAAMQAIEAGCPVQDIDVAALQAQLRLQKAVLELPGGNGIDSGDLAGIVIDDLVAEFTGHWTGSSFGNPVDGFGRHDGDADKGKLRANFRAELPAGRYEVRFAYSSAPNRCRAVPITVRHAGGVAEMTVDETKKPGHDGAFVSLGVFEFGADQPAEVSITNADTQGYVSVDAVQFLPQTE